jgi:hypothetical protein
VLSMLLDRASIGLSVICVLHCFATPILLAFAPSLLALPVADEKFHAVLIFLILPASLVALTLGCRRHGDMSVVYWGCGGLVVLLGTLVLGHDLLGDAGEKIMTVFGSGLVVIGHTLNFRACRASTCQH